MACPPHHAGQEEHRLARGPSPEPAMPPVAEVAAEPGSGEQQDCWLPGGAATGTRATPSCWRAGDGAVPPPCRLQNSSSGTGMLRASATAEAEVASTLPGAGAAKNMPGVCPVLYRGSYFRQRELAPAPATVYGRGKAMHVYSLFICNCMCICMLYGFVYTRTHMCIHIIISTCDTVYVDLSLTVCLSMPTNCS